MYIKRVLSLLVSFAVIISALCCLSPVTVSAASKKFNMSYVYFGSTDSYVDFVDATRGSLDEVAPSYFDLNEDGSLKLTSKLDPDFIKAMHNRGIKVVPFLSNHWNREMGRKALKNRESLAREIAEAVKKHNLDGVNIDIENLNEEDRNNYTDFVRLVREALGKNKTVAVAVAANPSGRNTGWPGSYDYSALAKYADYLMIMAYDESYQGSEPKAVASYRFVENSIKYALSKVSADKIVLGIPFYGRYWLGTEGGKGIGSNEIERLIKKYNGKVYFDDVTKSAKAVINITSSEKYSGGTISKGVYTFWYDNEQALKYKLSLVQKYNLKGTGSWSLGQEPQGTWDYYSLWLNGHYFDDISGHWAQDSILSAQKKGLMFGTGGSKFRPDLPTTRAQAATILVRALKLEPAKAVGETFRDVNGHWARQEIETAQAYGIIRGVGEGRFAPDEPITREQMAVMLDRILNLDIDPENLVYFIDTNVEELTWSYSAIIRLASRNVFSGYPNGFFYPKQNITRAQMAVLMDRLSEYFAAE